MEIRKLNTIRSIAAMIVLVSHYSNETKLFNGAFGNGAGQFGVMLFFILSGFLMSYLYMDKELSRNEIYSYATARIARVVPLFFFVVVFSYALQKLGITDVLYNIPDEASLLSHLALLSGTSVLWTIPAEIQFYFAFVLLWWFWKHRQGLLYVLLSFFFILLIFLDFPHPKGDFFGIKYDITLIPSLPYFLMGLIFGQLYVNWKVPKYLTSGMYVLVLLIIPLLFPRAFHYLTGYYLEMWKDLRILFCMSLVFFLLTFLVPDNNIFLSNRVGDFLGKISYSLYLLHFPVLWQLKKQALEAPELYLLVFLLVTIVISYLSYIVIENPSRKAIRRISSYLIAK